MLDLTKKNIHMDCIKAKTGNQITVEDDVNIPDLRPDIDKVIFHSGVIRLDEVKAMNGSVMVKGSLMVNVLYASEEEEEPLGKVEVSLPFEEQFHMDEVEAGDPVCMNYLLEDLSVSIINSRKISIRALLTMELLVRQIFDEAAAVDVVRDFPLEFRKKPLTIMETTVCKKDIFRFKQEEGLPAHLPNVDEVLYGSIQPGTVECIAGDEKLLLRGNMKLFFLYTPENEEGPARFYEHVIPLSGEIPCSDLHENMIPCVSVSVGSLEYEVKPDFDGEDRVFSIEAVLDLDIVAYEEKTYEIIADMYGITKEVQTICSEGRFMNLLQKNSGKARVKERIALEDASIMALLHHEENVVLEDVSTEGNTMNIQANLHLKCLYSSGDGEYGYFERDIPISYTMEIDHMTGKEVSWDIKLSVDQLEVMVLDGKDMECGGVVGITAVVFEEKKEEIITGCSIAELDSEKMKELPQMVIYVVKDGDSLWQIGKEYYIPVSAIREINNLSQDYCSPGEKLLLMKGWQTQVNE